MLALKWLKQRFIFFRRQLIELYTQSIYQPCSHFLLHRYNAHRCPHEAILFYNAMGRFFFMLRETIALISNNKLFKKSIQLDGFERVDYTTDYQQGSNRFLYPKSPMIECEIINIEEGYYHKIANSYHLCYTQKDETKDITHEWERLSNAFKEIFFDDNNALRQEKLENFRNDPEIYNKIFNDQYHHLSLEDGYTKSYLDAIDLISEYHRFASKINKEMLASVSESSAGNYLSVNYRGKKLSEHLLLSLVVAYDVISHVPFSAEKRKIILDIGAGFGGINRILNHYQPNSTQILIDLPETLVLTAYYIKYNFPNKKIALLEDLYENLDNLHEVLEEYDFIILPPFVLDYLKDESIDLVINVASLGFMSQEYLDYYLKAIQRTLKTEAYFYSLNSAHSTEWGIGSHAWDFQGDYLTILYNYDNRFSYPQWLGKKVAK